MSEGRACRDRLRDRLGEDEPRAPRIGGWHRGPDQGGAVARAPARSCRASTSSARIRTPGSRSERCACRPQVQPWPDGRARRRRELVRDGRHERARRARRRRRSRRARTRRAARDPDPDLGAQRGLARRARGAHARATRERRRRAERCRALVRERAATITIIAARSSPTGRDVARARAAGSVVPGRTHRLVFVLPDGSRRRPRRSRRQRAGSPWWRSIGFEPDEIVHVAREAAAATLTASLGDDSTVLVEISAARRARRRAAPRCRGCAGRRRRGRVDRSRVRTRAPRCCTPSESSIASASPSTGRGSTPRARGSSGSARIRGRRALHEPHPPERSTVTAERARAALGRADAPMPRRSRSGEWLVLGDAPLRARSWRRSHARDARARRGHAASVDDGCATSSCVGADLAPAVRARSGARAARRGAPARLWLVTRGACVVDGGGRTSRRSRAPSCGASAAS